MRDFVPETDIENWARYIVGIDFGGGLHPFAACLCAWTPDMERFYVIDGFKMMGDETLYHVKRIASMCKASGFRVGMVMTAM